MTGLRAVPGQEPICHSLDDEDRPLCGAELTGARAVHTLAQCRRAGHRTCQEPACREARRDGGLTR